MEYVVAQSKFLLIDLVMPGMSGLECARRLETLGAKPELIFMTGFPDTMVVEAAVHFHGASFLVKPFPLGQLATALNAVADDGLYLSPRAKALVAEAVSAVQIDSRAEPLSHLTRAELEVLSDYRRGLRCKEIADKRGTIMLAGACFAGLKPATNTGEQRGDYVIRNSNGAVKQDLSAVFSYIMNSEYDVTCVATSAVYASPNRKQGLCFTYLTNGFRAERLRSNSTSSNWNVTLRLKSYGSQDEVRSDPNTQVDLNGHAVRFTTPDVIYDYANDPTGMRQNFTIQHKPKAGNLILEFAVDLQDVQMEVDKAGNFAYFITGSNKRELMRYTNLKVWDAKGRQLVAQMKLQAPGRFAIVVDDREALYPVVVDPLTLDTSVIGDQAGEKFGFSVAAGGQTLDSNNNNGFIIVGAPDYAVGTAHNVGKVFVFAGGPSGAINKPAYWTAVGSQANQLFGWSVAVSWGNATLNDDATPDVVVGAPGYNLGGVFVWYGNSSNNPIFASMPDWTRYAPTLNDYEFGFSVAVVNGVLTDSRAQYLDSLVVGEPYYTWSQGQYTFSYAGAAYAYYGSSSGLSSSYSWFVKGAGSNYNLGYSVAGIKGMRGTDGTTRNGFADVFVGAPGVNNVYVYTNAGTALSTTAALVATDSSSGGSFGWSVVGIPNIDTSFDSALAVGAPGYTVGGNAGVGQVFVYTSLASVTAQQQLGPASSANAGSKFGYAVAAGDVTGDNKGD